MKPETEQRPFHETIVDAIRQASSTQLECLATLIKATKVPKGHDEIIAAWKAMCWGKDLGVPASLLKQKQATTKNVSKASIGSGISPDELQQEMVNLRRPP